MSATASDAAAERYRALGFSLTERGHHTLGSSNHLAVFGDDYLEILGFETGRTASRPELMRHPIGLAGICFKADDAAALVAELRARGLAVDPPTSFARPVGEGATAAFETVRLPVDMVENGRVFFCRHLTPDLVWPTPRPRHRNGAVAITEIVIAAPDPARTAGVYRLAFGDRALAPVPGGFRLRADRAVISILDPGVVAARFGAAVHIEAVSARMVALGLATTSCADAAACAGPAAVPFGGGVLVPAEAAFGCALLFDESPA